MKFARVDRLVSHYFQSLGWIVGKKPGYFIAIPALISVLLTLGFLKMNYVRNIEYLYGITNGPAQHEQLVTETYFPMNLSDNFDPSRITRVYPFARILIEAQNNKSIFDREVFNDLKIINGIVRNISTTHNNQEWNYERLCARKNNKCFENKVFDFEDRVDEMMDGNYTIEYPVMVDGNFDVFFSGLVLGGVTTNDFNMVLSATAVSIVYILQDGGEAMAWEDTFLQNMQHQEFDHVHFAYFTSQTLAEELDKLTLSALPLTIPVVPLVLTFSVFSCMMSDWTKSKPWLGIFGFVSTVAGMNAAYGLTAVCGVEFISLNIASFFLLVGIGLDDTFVLLAAWRRTDDRLCVAERLAHAYAQAGVTITISSLTNMLSFLTGLITPFRCIRIFCTYTAVAVLFTYIYHITLFGGCMALCGYAEHKSLHSFTCRPTLPRSLSNERSKCFRLFCTGGKNPLDPDNLKDNQENLMMRLFRDKLGVFLSKPKTKFSTVFLFLVYLFFSIWGCTRLKEGANVTDNISPNSYALEFFSLHDKYFVEYFVRIQVVIYETLDYSDHGVQEKVNNLLSEMENCDLVAGPKFTESWLRFYQRFLNDTRTKPFLQGLDVHNNKEDFYLVLRKIFLPFARHILDQDIKFNDDFTEIDASRFMIQARKVRTSEDVKSLMSKLREITQNSELSVAVFHSKFTLFDQMFVYKSTTFKSVGVAIAIMLVVLFIFIPNLSCVLWVGFTILSIEIGVIGLMTWWDVTLETVSMINLIMCIGFSVDYSAHISYAYISSDEKDSNMRMRNALYSLGLPILQSSISTLLGIIILTFTESHGILVFFKIVFLVTLLAAFHGLVFLPVFLSLTEGLTDKKTDFEKSDLSSDDDYSHIIESSDKNMIIYGTISTSIQSLPTIAEVDRKYKTIFAKKAVNEKICKENGKHYPEKRSSDHTYSNGKDANSCSKNVGEITKNK